MIDYRFIVASNTGDGIVFDVADTTSVVKMLKDIVDTNAAYCIQVFKFQGEITGMGMSSMGEIIFSTSGTNTMVFHMEDDELIEDELGFNDQFDIPFTAA